MVLQINSENSATGLIASTYPVQKSMILIINFNKHSFRNITEILSFSYIYIYRERERDLEAGHVLPLPPSAYAHHDASKAPLTLEKRGVWSDNECSLKSSLFFNIE